MKFDKLASYAPALVRYGVALVFILLGVSQLVDPMDWYALFPDQVLLSGLSIHQTVLFNGSFDILIGALLLVGLFTRVVTAIATLHMLIVIVVIGTDYYTIAVRDAGVLLASLSSFLRGPDKLCLDKKIFH